MSEKDDRDEDVTEAFLVKARRCKRCGGLLTSAEAVRDGYGHVCKMKTLAEQRERDPIPGQMDLSDFFPELKSPDKETLGK
jgi:hypothetical protein